jgi:hypothetical protein
MAVSQKGGLMGIRVAGLVLKEMIQFFRDRVMLVPILRLYIVEVVICALALSFDVKDIPLAVADLDRTPASRGLVEAFVVPETFTPAGFLARSSDATEWLQEGRARIALIVLKGFQRDLARGEAPAVQILVDGTNSNMGRASAWICASDCQSLRRCPDGGPTERSPGRRTGSPGLVQPGPDLYVIQRIIDGGPCGPDGGGYPPGRVHRSRDRGRDDRAVARDTH